MSRLTKQTALALVIIFIVLAINNTFYYYSTKKLLIQELDEKIENVAEQLRISIEHADSGRKFVEGLIAQHLRSASIAIQYALDPDINNVTTDQLLTLRDQLGVRHITLFTQTEDDIVGVRWTDPDEKHISTKNWSYWYDAFQELFALQPVTVDKGETLPNFWSGPYEISTANPKYIDKWGYYYDGTTNYMIDPYVGDDLIQAYNNEIGPPAVLDKLLSANPSLKEITVFNHAIFGTTPKESKNAKNETWVHLQRRPILYGSYELGDEKKDLESIHRAMEESRVITRLETVNGVRVYKSFVPVPVAELPYVIGITTDYSIIQNKLNEQFRNLAFIVLTATLLSIITVIAALRLFQQRKDTAVQSTQETYIHEVNELFTTIRGQRHDFLNQVQTIHTMASMGKIEDLKRFTSELIDDIHLINDIILIGNPALAALIQAKLVAAANKKINFTYDISDLDDIKLGVKSVDFVKIIGNLIDNAFDEVTNHSEDQRTVKLCVHEKDGFLRIRISNPCREMTEEELRTIFNPGFTTRGGKKHQGLGLAITKERVHYYKGTIKAYYLPEEGIVLEAQIPLS